MHVEQRTWTETTGWAPAAASGRMGASQLVLAFGAPSVLQRSSLVASLRADYPAAGVFGCSTAGGIRGSRVSDDSLVATAILFDHSLLHVASENLTGPQKASRPEHALGA
jgi:hypothetical protein